VDPDQPVWVLTPLEGAGPLRFGMLADEVETAVPEACTLSRFHADPYFPEISGVQFGSAPAKPALYAYFDGVGQLFCVAADAVYGPQVMLDGMELTGRPPALLEQVVADFSQSSGRTMSWGPRGNPGITDLGLVLRVQETETGLLTRPVVVGRDWADRCTDDWEGGIPECEWVGRQWPHRGASGAWDVYPPPGHKPNWPRGWRPPF
jgi:hypothetical protein